MDYILTFSIDRGEFTKIADCIVQLFPTETSATYFIPSQQSSQASGKLMFAYKKYRLRLQEAVLAGKRQRVQPHLSKNLYKK